MPIDDQIRLATEQIRSYGAVAVLGAGLSASRYPMAAQLPSLLWHAIDSNPAERLALATGLERPDATAKELIGEEEATVLAGWRVVENDPEVREAFQEAFARLDADREPTPAHYALARLLHSGLIEYVVSFNWDTALERAYEQLFGESLIGRTDLLAKPHGDAANPREDWVLPHQPGLVPQSVLDRIAEFSRERTRVLLVVGYSGSDEEVVQRLLDPVRGRWPVVRVGPTVSGPETITGVSDDVMPAIADALHAPVDIVGWRWVGFTRFRDLRAALMGYRLGPQDIRACPELPAVERVAERLTQGRFAVINGESGSGKSITAFQAAYRLHLEAWAVVELGQPGVASLDTVRVFESLRGPVLAVVDDAQALAPKVVQALERAVSHDHALIVVATDRSPGQEQVRVVGSHAVAALVQYCEVHSDMVEPLVSEVDDRVGYGMGKEPFPLRLENASKSDFPWQFMYVLSGGERRIADALANLADQGEADLLFGILAATQILTLDAGASRDDLLTEARVIDRDEEWFDKSLATLSLHRLVVNREDRLRTPHMRIADRGVLALGRDTANPRWHAFLAYIRSRLLDPTMALRGKVWLLRAIDQADPLRYGSPQPVLNDEVARFLVDTCLATPAGRDRSTAAYMLWEIEWWRALSREMAEEVASVLTSWIAEVTSEDVAGIAWLLGGLRSNFPALHGEISSSVSPEEIAERLQVHGSASVGESWGRLVVELAQAEGVDTQAWATRFEEATDLDKVSEWVGQDPEPPSLFGNAELVHQLAFTVPRVAAAVVTAMTPALIARLERDVTGTAQDLNSWAFSIFLFIGPLEEEVPEEDPRYEPLRAALRDLVARTNWETVGRSLTRAQLHETEQIDLLTFSLQQIAPGALTRMTSAVSLDELDRLTEGQWHDMTKIVHLVVSLGLAEDHEPARSWVNRHRDEIQDMPTRVVPIAPLVGVEVISRGGHIDLDPQGGLRWGWCAEALNSLVSADEDTAHQVIDGSRDEIMKSLVLRQSNMVKGLDDFVAALDSIDSGLLRELLAGVDPETASQHWSERLAGSPEEAAAARLLIDRSRQASGPIRDVAEALRRAN